MVFLDINTKNYKEVYKNGKTRLDFLNDLISKNNNNKVFILYYMEGCGPCNATRPEWSKIKNTLKQYNNSNEVAIVDIDQVLSGKIKNIQQPNSFPTIRFITNKGKNVENYEDSSVENKDRSIDSFVSWIKLKTPNKHNNEKKLTQKRHHYKKTLKNKYNNLKGGKWSRKYKNSINCNNPRGFSQRQYCKYGRK